MQAADLARGVGQAVRDQRLAAGWTQQDLGTASGMAQSGIARLEAGRHLPSLPVLLRVAKALNAKLAVDFLPGIRPPVG